MKKVAFIVSVLIILFIILVFYKGNNKMLEVDFGQPSDVHFSKTDDFKDEQKLIEETLQMLDHIMYLDDVEKEEKLGWFYLKKSSVIPDEPAYYITLDHLTDKATKARLSMNVSNKDVGMKLHADEVDQHYTTSDGMDVYLEEKYEIKMAYFEKDGFYYKIEGQNINDSSLTWDELKEKIEKMSKDNAFSKTVKTVLTKKSKSNFVMPGFFANNLDLTGVVIENTGLEFSYRNRHETSGKKSEITSSITYSVQDKPFRYEKKESKEISLANGVKADVIIAYDYPVESSSSYHQNVIFFEKDGFYFQIHSSNIESPINSKEAKQLVKIAESIK